MANNVLILLHLFILSAVTKTVFGTASSSPVVWQNGSLIVTTESPGDHSSNKLLGMLEKVTPVTGSEQLSSHDLLEARDETRDESLPEVLVSTGDLIIQTEDLLPNTDQAPVTSKDDAEERKGISPSVPPIMKTITHSKIQNGSQAVPGDVRTVAMGLTNRLSTFTGEAIKETIISETTRNIPDFNESLTDTKHDLPYTAYPDPTEGNGQTNRTTRVVTPYANTTSSYTQTQDFDGHMTSYGQAFTEESLERNFSTTGGHKYDNISSKASGVTDIDTKYLNSTELPSEKNEYVSISTVPGTEFESDNATSSNEQNKPEVDHNITNVSLSYQQTTYSVNTDIAGNSTVKNKASATTLQGELTNISYVSAQKSATTDALHGYNLSVKTIEPTALIAQQNVTGTIRNNTTQESNLTDITYVFPSEIGGGRTSLTVQDDLTGLLESHTQLNRSMLKPTAIPMDFNVSTKMTNMNTTSQILTTQIHYTLSMQPQREVTTEDTTNNGTKDPLTSMNGLQTGTANVTQLPLSSKTYGNGTTVLEAYTSYSVNVSEYRVQAVTVDSSNRSLKDLRTTEDNTRTLANVTSPVNTGYGEDAVTTVYHNKTGSKVEDSHTTQTIAGNERNYYITSLSNTGDTMKTEGNSTVSTPVYNASIPSSDRIVPEDITVTPYGVTFLHNVTDVNFVNENTTGIRETPLNETVYDTFDGTNEYVTSPSFTLSSSLSTDTSGTPGNSSASARIPQANVRSSTVPNVSEITISPEMENITSPNITYYVASDSSSVTRIETVSTHLSNVSQFGISQHVNYTNVNISKYEGTTASMLDGRVTDIGPTYYISKVHTKKAPTLIPGANASVASAISNTLSYINNSSDNGSYFRNVTGSFLTSSTEVKDYTSFDSRNITPLVTAKVNNFTSGNVSTISSNVTLTDYANVVTVSGTFSSLLTGGSGIRLNTTQTDVLSSYDHNVSSVSTITFSGNLTDSVLNYTDFKPSSVTESETSSMRESNTSKTINTTFPALITDLSHYNNITTNSTSQMLPTAGKRLNTSSDTIYNNNFTTQSSIVNTKAQFNRLTGPNLNSAENQVINVTDKVSTLGGDDNETFKNSSNTTFNLFTKLPPVENYTSYSVADNQRTTANVEDLYTGKFNNLSHITTAMTVTTTSTLHDVSANGVNTTLHDVRTLPSHGATNVNGHTWNFNWTISMHAFNKSTDMKTNAHLTTNLNAIGVTMSGMHETVNHTMVVNGSNRTDQAAPIHSTIGDVNMSALQGLLEHTVRFNWSTNKKSNATSSHQQQALSWPTSVYVNMSTVQDVGNHTVSLNLTTTEQEDTTVKPDGHYSINGSQSSFTIAHVNVSEVSVTYTEGLNSTKLEQRNTTILHGGCCNVSGALSSSTVAYDKVSDLGATVNYSESLNLSIQDQGYATVTHEGDYSINVSLSFSAMAYDNVSVVHTPINYTERLYLKTQELGNTTVPHEGNYSVNGSLSLSTNAYVNVSSVVPVSVNYTESLNSTAREQGNISITHDGRYKDNGTVGPFTVTYGNVSGFKATGHYNVSLNLSTQHEDYASVTHEGGYGISVSQSSYTIAYTNASDVQAPVNNTEILNLTTDEQGNTMVRHEGNHGIDGSLSLSTIAFVNVTTDQAPIDYTEILNLTTKGQSKTTDDHDGNYSVDGLLRSPTVTYINVSSNQASVNITEIFNLTTGEQRNTTVPHERNYSVDGSLSSFTMVYDNVSMVQTTVKYTESSQSSTRAQGNTMVPHESKYSVDDSRNSATPAYVNVSGVQATVNHTARLKVTTKVLDNDIFTSNNYNINDKISSSIPGNANVSAKQASFNHTASLNLATEVQRNNTHSYSNYSVYDTLNLTTEARDNATISHGNFSVTVSSFTPVYDVSGSHETRDRTPKLDSTTQLQSNTMVSYGNHSFHDTLTLSTPAYASVSAGQESYGHTGNSKLTSKVQGNTTIQHFDNSINGTVISSTTGYLNVSGWKTTIDHTAGIFFTTKNNTMVSHGSYSVHGSLRSSTPAYINFSGKHITDTTDVTMVSHNSHSDHSAQASSAGYVNASRHIGTFSYTDILNLTTQIQDNTTIPHGSFGVNNTVSSSTHAYVSAFAFTKGVEHNTSFYLTNQNTSTVLRDSYNISSTPTYINMSAVQNIDNSTVSVNLTTRGNTTVSYGSHSVYAAHGSTTPADVTASGMQGALNHTLHVNWTMQGNSSNAYVDNTDHHALSPNPVTVVIPLVNQSNLHGSSEYVDIESSTSKTYAFTDLNNTVLDGNITYTPAPITVKKYNILGDASTPYSSISDIQLFTGSFNNTVTPPTTDNLFMNTSYTREMAPSISITEQNVSSKPSSETNAIDFLGISTSSGYGASSTEIINSTFLQSFTSLPIPGPSLSPRTPSEESSPSGVMMPNHETANFQPVTISMSHLNTSISIEYNTGFSRNATVFPTDLNQPAEGNITLSYSQGPVLALTDEYISSGFNLSGNYTTDTLNATGSPGTHGSLTDLFTWVTNISAKRATERVNITDSSAVTKNSVTERASIPYATDSSVLVKNVTGLSFNISPRITDAYNQSIAESASMPYDTDSSVLVKNFTGLLYNVSRGITEPYIQSITVKKMYTLENRDDTNGSRYTGMYSPTLDAKDSNSESHSSHHAPEISSMHEITELSEKAISTLPVTASFLTSSQVSIFTENENHLTPELRMTTNSPESGGKTASAAYSERNMLFPHTNRTFPSENASTALIANETNVSTKSIISIVPPNYDQTVHDNTVSSEGIQTTLSYRNTKPNYSTTNMTAISSSESYNNSLANTKNISFTEDENGFFIAKSYPTVSPIETSTTPLIGNSETLILSEKTALYVEGTQMTSEILKSNSSIKASSSGTKRSVIGTDSLSPFTMHPGTLSSSSSGTALNDVYPINESTSTSDTTSAVENLLNTTNDIPTGVMKAVTKVKGFSEPSISPDIPLKYSVDMLSTEATVPGALEGNLTEGMVQSHPSSLLYTDVTETTSTDSAFKQSNTLTTRGNLHIVTPTVDNASKHNATISALSSTNNMTSSEEKASEGSVTSIAEGDTKTKSTETHALYNSITTYNFTTGSTAAGSSDGSTRANLTMTQTDVQAQTDIRDSTFNQVTTVYDIRYFTKDDSGFDTTQPLEKSASFKSSAEKGNWITGRTKTLSVEGNKNKTESTVSAPSRSFIHTSTYLDKKEDVTTTYSPVSTTTVVMDSEFTESSFSVTEGSITVPSGNKGPDYATHTSGVTSSLGFKGITALPNNTVQYVIEQTVFMTRRVTINTLVSNVSSENTPTMALRLNVTSEKRLSTLTLPKEHDNCTTKASMAPTTKAGMTKVMTDTASKSFSFENTSNIITVNDTTSSTQATAENFGSQPSKHFTTLQPLSNLRSTTANGSVTSRMATHVEHKTTTNNSVDAWNVSFTVSSVDIKTHESTTLTQQGITLTSVTLGSRTDHSHNASTAVLNGTTLETTTDVTHKAYVGTISHALTKSTQSGPYNTTTSRAGKTFSPDGTSLTTADSLPRVNKTDMNNQTIHLTKGTSAQMPETTLTDVLLQESTYTEEGKSVLTSKSTNTSMASLTYTAGTPSVLQDQHTTTVDGDGGTVVFHSRTQRLTTGSNLYSHLITSYFATTGSGDEDRPGELKSSEMHQMTTHETHISSKTLSGSFGSTTNDPFDMTTLPDVVTAENSTNYASKPTVAVRNVSETAMVWSSAGSVWAETNSSQFYPHPNITSHNLNSTENSATDTPSYGAVSVNGVTSSTSWTNVTRNVRNGTNQATATIESVTRTSENIPDISQTSSMYLSLNNTRTHEEFTETFSAIAFTTNFSNTQGVKQNESDSPRVISASPATAYNITNEHNITDATAIPTTGSKLPLNIYTVTAKSTDSSTAWSVAAYSKNSSRSLDYETKASIGSSDIFNSTVTPANNNTGDKLGPSPVFSTTTNGINQTAPANITTEKFTLKSFPLTTPTTSNTSSTTLESQTKVPISESVSHINTSSLLNHSLALTKEFTGLLTYTMNGSALSGITYIWNSVSENNVTSMYSINGSGPTTHSPSNTNVVTSVYEPGFSVVQNINSTGEYHITFPEASNTSDVPSANVTLQDSGSRVQSATAETPTITKVLSNSTETTKIFSVSSINITQLTTLSQEISKNATIAATEEVASSENSTAQVSYHSTALTGSHTASLPETTFTLDSRSEGMINTSQGANITSYTSALPTEWISRINDTLTNTKELQLKMNDSFTVSTAIESMLSANRSSTFRSYLSSKSTDVHLSLSSDFSETASPSVSSVSTLADSPNEISISLSTSVFSSTIPLSYTESHMYSEAETSVSPTTFLSTDKELTTKHLSTSESKILLDTTTRPTTYVSIMGDLHTPRRKYSTSDVPTTFISTMKEDVQTSEIETTDKQIDVTSEGNLFSTIHLTTGGKGFFTTEKVISITTPRQDTTQHYTSKEGLIWHPSTIPHVTTVMLTKSSAIISPTSHVVRETSVFPTTESTQVSSAKHVAITELLMETTSMGTTKTPETSMYSPTDLYIEATKIHYPTSRDEVITTTSSEGAKTLKTTDTKERIISTTYSKAYSESVTTDLHETSSIPSTIGQSTSVPIGSSTLKTTDISTEGASTGLTELSSKASTEDESTTGFAFETSSIADMTSSIRTTLVSTTRSVISTSTNPSSMGSIPVSLTDVPVTTPVTIWIKPLMTSTSEGGFSTTETTTSLEGQRSEEGTVVVIAFASILAFVLLGVACVCLYRRVFHHWFRGCQREAKLDVEAGTTQWVTSHGARYITPYNTVRTWSSDFAYNMYSQNNKLWILTVPDPSEETRRRPLGGHITKARPRIPTNAYSKEVMLLSSSWADTLGGNPEGEPKLGTQPMNTPASNTTDLSKTDANNGNKTGEASVSFKSEGITSRIKNKLKPSISRSSSEVSNDRASEEAVYVNIPTSVNIISRRSSINNQSPGAIKVPSTERHTGHVDVREDSITSNGHLSGDDKNSTSSADHASSKVAMDFGTFRYTDPSRLSRTIDYGSFYRPLENQTEISDSDTLRIHRPLLARHHKEVQTNKHPDPSGTSQEISDNKGPRAKPRKGSTKGLYVKRHSGTEQPAVLKTRL